jgi:hypothetical protein
MLFVRHMLGALDRDNMVKAPGLEARCALCLNGRDGEAGYMYAVVLGQPLGRRPIAAADITHVLPRIEF